MKEVLQFFELLGSPYSDLVAVAVLSILLYLLALVLTFLFDRKSGKKVEKETKETASEIEIPKVETAASDKTESEIKDEFKSFVEPQLIIEQKDLVTKEVETSKEIIKVAPEREIPDEFRPQKTKTIEPKASTKEIVEEPVIEQKAAEKIDEQPKESFFSRLTSGLSKTQQGLFGRLGSVFTGGKIDDKMWDDFEEILITSDIGVATTMKLREKLSSKLYRNNSSDMNGLKTALKEEVLHILKQAEGKPADIEYKPLVLMVAGVNGVGKTTTIGKLANMFASEGNKVMVAAADTFRAAAVEQLEIWANRVGSDFLKGKTGADPSAVAFDAVEASCARGIDVLIIDTAGRLHTKSNLMDELKKLKRVTGKALDGAPHETLLVLDATTGQNAVQQAKLFNEAIEVTGIVLTKLDGTAKGGVIIAIADELNIPVKYIGVGEGLNDLRNFNADEFVEALFISEKTIH
ncbi:MAG: signal recognition particle-docking protein FtsY [Thermodesulfobacteriota bacterium]